MESVPAATATGLHRVDDTVISLLSLLLPAGFRARQRGEWAGDLLAMAHDDPAARRRYLIGAARTLPSLRGAIRRRDTPAAEVPPGVRPTLAHILLYGMAWPILCWLFWVPARYLIAYHLGSPEGTGPLDESAMWPVWETTPNWLRPVTAAIGLTAFAVHTSGPILLAAVGLIGTATTALRHRRHRPHRLTAALTVLTVLLATTIWATALNDLQDNHGADTAGLLGAAAAALATTTAGLRTRTRAGLLLLSAGAIAMFLSFQTSAGYEMLNWFWE